MPRTSQLLTLAAALAVLACANALAAADSSSAPAQSSASPDKTTEEVTVTAERAKLAKRVSKFVGQIAALENEEGLPRWNVPVCPLESGLPRQEGEWIMSRFVEIAHAAGVQMARGHCRPNLIIVASSDPEVVLRRTMANNRSRLITFGNATRFALNELISNPRVVRVWYSSSEGAGQSDGEAVVGGLKATDQPSGPLLSDATHIGSNVAWSFSRVIEIADQSRMRGVTLGQFADYVAMVGLAEIKPGARFGDAPSILKVFDGSPKAAPSGMTDWDRAFLKSLYATDQLTRLQRRELGRAMVRELAH